MFLNPVPFFKIHHQFPKAGLLILSLILFSSANATGFEAGVTAYKAKNHQTVLQEWIPLAEQGDVHAQYNIGTAYMYGDGVVQDYKQAAKWYTLAADQGDAHAQGHLGPLYHYGVGVVQEYKQAVLWYTLAADQGDAHAQSYLGLMYQNGLGVVQDYVIAHMWVNMASANGHSKSAQFRDLLAKKMTLKQIEQAEKKAREWVTNHNN